MHPWASHSRIPINSLAFSSTSFTCEELLVYFFPVVLRPRRFVFHTTDARTSRARATMDASSVDQARRILFSHTIKAYEHARCPRGLAQSSRPKATVGEILRLCRTHEVSAALVRGDGDASDTRRVSVRDIGRAFVRANEETTENDVMDCDAFWRANVVDELGLGQNVPRCRANETTTLLDVVTVLRDASCVVVVNDDDDVMDVITRFDIVEFLNRQSEILGEIADRVVSRLFPAKSVPRCPADANALYCLREMSRQNISAIALTDERAGGEIIANFSMNDLRRIEHPSGLARLRSCSALEFMSSSRSECFRSTRAPFADERRRSTTDVNVPPTHAYVELIFARAESTTFAEVLRLMSSHRVHRVYVLSRALDREVCVGALTPEDVIRALAI